MRWGAGADGLWSYDVSVQVSVTAYSRERKEVVPTGVHELRQRYLHGRWRVDFVNTLRKYTHRPDESWQRRESETEAFAYSGGSVRFLATERRFGEIREVGTFLRGKLLSPQLFELHKSHFFGESYLDMLEPRASSTEVLETPDSVTLRLPSPTDLSTRHSLAESDFEVVLQRQLGWQPTVIRHGRNLLSAPGVYSEIENRLTEVLPSVWAPTHSTWSVYSPDYGGSADSPVAVTTIDVDLARSHFNIDIGPEVFELPFPPGTTVYDASSADNYVQGSDGNADYRAFTETAKERVQRARIDVHSDDSTHWWLLIVNGVALLAVVVYYLRRR